MDAPPSQEDSRPFVTLAAALRPLGWRTPYVHAIDLSAGLLLLEDMGRTTLFDAIAHSDPRVDRWLDIAVGALAEVTHQGKALAARLSPYDEVQVRRELGLFPTWFVRRHLDGPDIDDDARWRHACRYLVDCWRRMPHTVVHLDYHCRNLMVLENATLGVIDFQDAVRGPAAYDLASLLKDCYVTWPTATIERLLAHYRLAAALPCHYDQAQLYEDATICGIQRHLKVAGIFARLYYRDGKERYLSELPRVIGYLRAALPAFAALAPLADFLPSDQQLDAAYPCEH